MWLFTPRGFYSVVRKPEDAKGDTLTIRTRNRADIDALADLFPDAKPFRVKASDYAWRIRVPREEWMHACARMAAEVDYSNFKDEVTDRQGYARHDVYLRVWSVLLHLRDPDKRQRRSRRAGSSRYDDAPWGDYDTDSLFGGRL
jgi:hypothetical protein